MKKYTVIEILTLGVLVVFIAALFVSQAGGTKNPINKVMVAPLKVMGTKDLSEKSLNETVKTFLIDGNLIEDCSYYACDDVMNVSEILVIKLKDKNDVKLVQKAIKSRVEKQKELFRNYAPSQYSLLDNCVIRTSGNLLFYCTAKNASDVYSAYKKSL